MTKIYVYNQNTFEFIREQDLQIDPEESLKARATVYAFPPLNSTTIKPEEKDGFIPFFDIKEKKWILKEDLRGKKVINLETQEIKTIYELNFELKNPYHKITDEEIELLLSNRNNYVTLEKNKLIIKEKERTEEDIDKEKSFLYRKNVDKYTLQITRLKLKEQTPEIKEKIKEIIKKIEVEEEKIKELFKD